MRVSLIRVAVAIAALAIATVAFLAAAIAETATPEESTAPRGRLESAIHLLNLMAEPGPLSLPHASLDNDASCGECHTVTQGVPDSACLACHTLVGQRLASAEGWHGQVEGQCITCHSDHEGRDFSMVSFDMPAFNHDLAIWRLEGAHRDLECSQCHLEHADVETNVGWQFLGMSQACAECHTDPHGSTLGDSCTRCHTQGSWADTHLFDHETMTDFPLANLHAGLQCTACHAPEAEGDTTRLFHLGGGDCATCHTEIESVLSGERFAAALGETLPDVHHGEIDCQSCHSVEDSGVHLSVIAPRCVECHTPAHGQQIFETARLIEESLQGSDRDARGRLTGGPFAGLGGSALMHNPVAWMETLGSGGP